MPSLWAQLLAPNKHRSDTERRRHWECLDRKRPEWPSLLKLEERADRKAVYKSFHRTEEAEEALSGGGRAEPQSNCLFEALVLSKIQIPGAD